MRRRCGFARDDPQIAVVARVFARYRNPEGTPPMQDKHRLVFKIAGREEWSAAARDGRYAGSADDARDGFIHLSSIDQLAGTLARHFAGRSDLVLVAFDEARLVHALKWEPSRGGALFPHYYGVLDPNAAVSVEAIALDMNGRHLLPQRGTT
jgi:uncharacterized protein (DUF952 family)